MLFCLEEFDGFGQNFIAAGADALDGRLDTDVGLDADSLKLAAVRMADVMPGEIDRNGPGQDGGCDVPVGAVGRTSDESRAGRRFKEQARMLGSGRLNWATAIFLSAKRGPMAQAVPLG